MRSTTCPTRPRRELWIVMQAGSFPAVFITAGLALAARRPRLAVALATAGTATWLLAKVVKQVVDRGRPQVFLHDVVVYGPAASGLGFPSGHAAVAACLMTVAAPYLTRPARVIGWVVVLLVTFTRVFVGAHFPLDAAGGLFLGWAVGSVATLIAGRPAGHGHALACAPGGVSGAPYASSVRRASASRVRVTSSGARRAPTSSAMTASASGMARARTAQPAGVMRAHMTRLSLGHGARSANPRASRRSTRRVTPALLTSSRAPMSFMRRRPSGAASRPDSTSNSSSEMSISPSSRALRVSCSTRPARTTVAHNLRNSCGDLAVSLRLMASAYPCFTRDYHG